MKKKSSQVYQDNSQAEIDDFFKKIGLGTEEKRAKFKKFEQGQNQEIANKYEIRLTNDSCDG